MNWLGYAADIIGILGAVFALLAWLKARELQKELQNEKERQLKEIQVVLTDGKNKIELPVKLRRVEFTRSEILGRIGMIPTKKKKGKEQERFSLSYLGKAGFLQQIEQIKEGPGNGVLTIPCDEEELQQFNLSAWSSS